MNNMAIPLVNEKYLKLASNLISPVYHKTGRVSKGWCLLRVSIQEPPEWAKQSKYVTKKYCWFREIAYLNDKNEVVGLGRSWIPLNYIGFRMFFKALKPFQSAPIGIILKRRYGSDIEIDIIKCSERQSILVPYRVEQETIVSFERVLKQKSNGSILLFAEEDFIIDAFNE